MKPCKVREALFDIANMRPHQDARFEIKRIAREAMHEPTEREKQLEEENRKLKRALAAKEPIIKIADDLFAENTEFYEFIAKVHRTAWAGYLREEAEELLKLPLVEYNPEIGRGIEQTFTGTRIYVKQVIECVRAGMSKEDLKKLFPTLSEKQIQYAIDLEKD